MLADFRGLAVVDMTELRAKARQEGVYLRVVRNSLAACVDEYEALEVKALAIGGTLLAASEIDRVAKLPTRSEALGLLMSVMLAPIGKLVRTLNEVPGQLVRTLAAVGEAKATQAGAPAEEGAQERQESAPCGERRLNSS